MAGKNSRHHHFENNPFFIAANGITLFAGLAQSLFVFFLVLAMCNLLFNGFTPDPSQFSVSNIAHTVHAWQFGDWIVAGGSGFILLLAALMLSALLGGVSSYASACLANGKQVRFRTAFLTSFENLWAYLWLQIIIFVKILLWSLLFIVPGIVMMVRYSLAGVAFYDEQKHLRGNAAVKESLRLTKKGWITTYAANALFNILTLGTISTVVSTSVNAVLYRQFNQVGGKKPDAHWLSWATLLIPIFVVLLFIAFASLAALVATLVGLGTL